MSDFLQPHGLQPRLLCTWNSADKNIGVGSHSLLQGSSQPRDRTQVSHIAGRFFIVWAAREAPESPLNGNSMCTNKIPYEKEDVISWQDIPFNYCIHFMGISKLIGKWALQGQQWFPLNHPSCLLQGYSMNPAFMINSSSSFYQLPSHC